jgi:hypothetical protein
VQFLFPPYPCIAPLPNCPDAPFLGGTVFPLHGEAVGGPNIAAASSVPRRHLPVQSSESQPTPFTCWNINASACSGICPEQLSRYARILWAMLSHQDGAPRQQGQRNQIDLVEDSERNGDSSPTARVLEGDG